MAPNPRFVPRFYRLHELRSLLEPHYGVHCDAVISILGNYMTPAALDAAVKRDILEAHALKNVDLQGIKGTSLERLIDQNGSAASHLEWDQQLGLPAWMKRKKSLGTPPSSRPDVVVSLHDCQDKLDFGMSTARMVLVHPVKQKIWGMPAGFIEFHEKGPLLDSFGPYSNCVWVEAIQNLTGGSVRKDLAGSYRLQFGRLPTAAERNRMKNWEYGGLEKLEHHVSELGRRYVVVNTASDTDAGSDAPIHHSLLHFYGRLLQQSGYKLEEIQNEKKPDQYFLSWVKDLRAAQT